MFDRVFGLERLVRQARPFHPAYLLILLLFLIPHSALAQCCQSGAEWTAYKSKCGLPDGLLYNDWLAEGTPCPTNNAASSTTTPTVTVPTSKQQVATQLGTLGGNMIASAVQQLLFGNPQPPPDPAEQQRQLAAQQLNNSGIYLFKQKNYAGAINEFQKALTITPDDANILHNLALAKQQLKNVAVAGQTSGALGLLLGTSTGNSANFNLGDSTNSPAPNPNSSALNLVNLDPDANASNSHGTATQPSAQLADTQDTLQALDNALGNGLDPEVKRQLDDFANTELPQHTDSNSAPRASDAQPEIQKQGTGAEATTKDIDEAIGQNPSAGSADAAAQLRNSTALDNIANPDFDGRTTGNAPIEIGHPNPGPPTPAAAQPSQSAGTPPPNAQAGSGNANPAPSAPVAPGQNRSPDAQLTAVSGGMPTGAEASGVRAPGHPIVDCDGDAAAINRLLSGLPAQQEAIKRTQAALDAAREDAQHDSAEAREKWMEGTVKMLASTASFIAGSSQKLLASEGALQAAGIPTGAGARFKFLQKIKAIQELSEKLEGAGNSYLAGNAYGNAVFVQQTARDLRGQIAEARNLLVDSGIAEEAGGKLVLALWGPIGELGFSEVNTGLDLLMASMQAGFSAAEAEQAARNLEVMQSQYQRTQDKIYELKQEIAEGCSK